MHGLYAKMWTFYHFLPYIRLGIFLFLLESRNPGVHGREKEVLELNGVLQVMTLLEIRWLRISLSADSLIAKRHEELM